MVVRSPRWAGFYRLTEARETAGGTQTWRQTFGYDRYGNRTAYQKWLGSTQQTLTAAEHPAIDAATNRISPPGYTFDANGNLIVDAEGRQFTFNGDNKQTEVRDAANNVVGRYFYDGEGKRVKKYVPSTGEVTVFVYDAQGKLVAEYSTIVAPQQEAKVAYLTNDHLGSPRINTDQNGNVSARHDYHPFGEEIARTGYGADTIRKQFTSYERDNESELDFAQARYYNFRHGRFTSADEPFVGQDFTNPQTINLYTYTSNNPLNRIDPDGNRWYMRDVEIDGRMTRQIVWVNPNDDGSYTAPEGEGWQAFIPTDDNRTFAVGIDGGRKVIYLGENEDGSPYIGRALWTGRVDSADEDLLAVVPLARGAWSVAKGIFGKALTSWFARQSVKTLTTQEITAIGEKALADFAEQQAENVIKGFTKHGINQAISKNGVGVSSKAMLDAVKNPIKVLDQADGTIRYIGKNAVVILNKSGEVVTTWARNRTGRRIQPK